MVKSTKGEKKMKRYLCILLALCLLFTMCQTVFAEGEKVLGVNDITDLIGDVTKESDYFTIGGNYKRSAVGFANVDLTGIRSIEIKAKEYVGENGEIFRVKIDDPNSESIGEVVFGSGENTAAGNIKAQTGVHTLYLYTTNQVVGAKWEIESITLKTEPEALITPVPDSKIVDNWHDTWVATDSYGRKVADYEEVGPVKEGTRKVGMMYWFAGLSTGSNGVIPEIIRNNPNAFGNFSDPAWNNGGNIKSYWWGEPVYGFYKSADYWVFKKQGTLMANAGIDAVFLDFTNDYNVMTAKYTALLKAYHDAREEGTNVPKISFYGQMGGKDVPQETLPVIYYNQVKSGEYDDLIFEWEGKPMYISHPVDDKYKDVEDEDIVRLYQDIEDEFCLFEPGELRGGSGNPNLRHVNWLEEFPQHPFGIGKSGRRESMSLGVGINQSYVDGPSVVGVFSDPYTKGKGYSEAFGEDYSKDNARKAYFFREQASHVLDVDPEFVFVDGWNEWQTPCYSSYGAHKGTIFVDLFDEENSRDFEPSKSYIKDDYYNLLVDFIRKYKGVRPAPTASEQTVIDINAGAAQWDNVGPEFINDYDNYERNTTAGTDFYTGEPIHYETKVNNSISRAKVARDNDNFYFYVKTVSDIKTGTVGFMNLYINIDRNPATGWEGYDFAVNLNGLGVISKAVGNVWNWETAGNAEYTVQGNVLQMKVPKWILGEAGVADFEFKWTDSITPDGDYLDFYSEGSSAPVGKFNYLYTEIAQTCLTEDQRSILSDTTIVKAGATKAIINGGKMPVYEKDTSVAPFEMNGTCYVPLDTFEEILGYGYSKVEYLAEDNTVYLGRYDLEDTDQYGTYSKIVNYEWTYSVIGSYEARNNGKLAALTNPCVTANGIVYVPLTYVSDVFGWDIKSLGNGAYAVSKDMVNITVASLVLNHIQ